MTFETPEDYVQSIAEHGYKLTAERLAATLFDEREEWAGYRANGDAQLDGLRRALVDANELLRSVHAIAGRYEDDDKTNWSAVKARLDGALERQHALMYPKAPSDV